MQKNSFGGTNVHPVLRRIAVSAFAVLGCVFMSNAAQAQPVPVAPHILQTVSEGATTSSTAGWARFCERVPAECVVNLAEPATIKLTNKTWQTIERINRQVNAAIRPMTDASHWGVEDRWDFAEDGYGDCEDYQLVKRRLLVKAGLSRRAMRMTVVIDDEGQGHAVLMVRTNRGDFILDNKRNAVLSWHQTGYALVKREGANSAAWVSLGGQTSPAMTATRW